MFSDFHRINQQERMDRIEQQVEKLSKVQSLMNIFQNVVDHMKSRRVQKKFNSRRYRSMMPFGDYEEGGNTYKCPYWDESLKEHLTVPNLRSVNSVGV